MVGAVRPKAPFPRFFVTLLSSASALRAPAAAEKTTTGEPRASTRVMIPPAHSLAHPHALGCARHPLALSSPALEEERAEEAGEAARGGDMSRSGSGSGVAPSLVVVAMSGPVLHFCCCFHFAS